MNIKRLINALEKAGLKVIKTDTNEYKKAIGHYTVPFWHYYCVGETYKCDFWPNGNNNDGTPSETCVTVQVMRKNERNQAEIDYFPGRFCRTIKDVVECLGGK